ncbi:TlpA family protein disulfide reductase [Proteiniphilum sp. UBA5384]|uniref:TlpA family protein disulfide reductase n=1 Tax=Proteiniphilum sp. UBA5384 TaxID=1947279 RepID=UPI0025F9507C|nr:TlpA disulfide reductase family protein [Proteiniphilum sp. UBA5384]
MKHLKWYCLPLIASLLLTSLQMQAQLLKGYIQMDSIPDMQLAYTPDGDILNMIYREIQPEADGSFNIDLPLPNGMLDVNIYVENDIFGAHLEEGKCTVIRLYPFGPEGHYSSDFDGDNIEPSRFYNAYSQAFDIMKYFSPDPADSKPITEYQRILEEEYAALKKLLPTIEDEALRNHYAKLSEGMYTWTKIRILMDQAENEERDIMEYKEYSDLVKDIDPNNEDNISTNLTYAWLGGQHKLPNDYNADQTDYYIESMQIVERNVTNPKARFILTRYIAHNYFTYEGGQGDVKRFWEHYKDFAKDYPELLAGYEIKLNSITGIVPGSEIPYDPVLTRSDGTTCKLSDLSGAFLYIDIWATWCSPCLKEIPYLKKVAEHFEGNEQINIIGISIDENHNAWLRRVERDQHSWEQFILIPEECKEFMTRWGIGQIPRFIMLDKEGKIFSVDAMRPSDENLIRSIEEQL